jgi:DNA replication protein DnaC
MTGEELQAEMDGNSAEAAERQEQENQARLAATVERHRAARAERDAQQAAEQAAVQAEIKRIGEEHERHIAEEAAHETLLPPYICGFCGDKIEPRKIGKRHTATDTPLHPECCAPWEDVHYSLTPGQPKSYTRQIFEKYFRESAPRFEFGATCTICGEPAKPENAERRSVRPAVHLHHGDCVAAHERQKAKEREEHRLEGLRNRLARDIDKKLEQIPRFRPCVGNPEFERAVSEPEFSLAAKNWTPADGSLLILGPTGIGKTVTTSAILQRLGSDLLAVPEVIEIAEYDMFEGRNRTERYSLGCLESLTWTTGYAVTFARRNSSLGAEPPLLEKCKTASLLVIDEVGQEPVGDGALFDVVDARHAAGLVTIITSGLTRTAFREKYGDACDRRLTQEGIGVAIESVLKSGGLKVVK